MSTRCQILIKEEGLRDEQIMLYHHSDGYPEHILPEIKAAYALATKDKTNAWRAGRAGKAASYLCAIDPGVFEPEVGLDLHGDIDYFYELYVCETKWEIQIIEMGSGGKKDIVLSRRLLET